MNTTIQSSSVLPEIISVNRAWEEQRVRVSGTLICYKQETFVAQALASVLNQTYPIDLIISDDCSPDRTAAVIRESLKDYRGHHRVRLRAGGRNLGVCGNQNATIELAEGELIVLFEGDDVSSPTRVEKLVDAYLKQGRKIGALGSAIRLVDTNGQRKAEVSWPTESGDAYALFQGKWEVHGCGLALRRDCFFEIGPISKGLMSGDIALWMRAAFLKNGGMVQVREPLVDYRLHSHNVSKRFVLEFTSPDVLKTRCRNLLHNEIAQVLELRKIRRYRRRAGLQGDALESVWEAVYHHAQVRARLVLAISRRSRIKWIWPAMFALRFPKLRRTALHAIGLAVVPSVWTLYCALKRRHVFNRFLLQRRSSETATSN